jgi:hypothetical protein
MTIGVYEQQMTYGRTYYEAMSTSIASKIEGCKQMNRHWWDPQEQGTV